MVGHSVDHTVRHSAANAVSHNEYATAADVVFDILAAIAFKNGAMRFLFSKLAK